MDKMIPFNKPYVPEASKKYVMEALESDHQQGDGPFTKRASKMISVDPNIGLAVIFSYDYFYLFHLCLADFFRNPDSFTRENINFVNMRNKIY
ncbi:MAG: hypothetical protein EBU33_10785 [Sphingobacteriia bacterium]|nr:hypothetical protein [Sphingobacteriia bacterium]